jgi:hypothetical protein
MCSKWEQKEYIKKKKTCSENEAKGGDKHP